MNQELSPSNNYSIKEAQKAIKQFDGQWNSAGIAKKTEGIFKILCKIGLDVDIPGIYKHLVHIHTVAVKYIMDFTSLEQNEHLTESYCGVLADCVDEEWNDEYRYWMYGIADKKIILASGDRFRASSERLWNIELDLQYLHGIRYLVRRPLKNAIQQMIRLYVLGQDADCIAKCRSVIEFALKKIVRYPALEKHLRKESYCMADRLSVCRKMKLFPEDGINMAYDTITCANKIIHEDPCLSGNVKKYIGNTIAVVTGIFTGICENNAIVGKQVLKDLFGDMQWGLDI